MPPSVVVITGASAGVGRATVRAFAKEGAVLGLIARGDEGLQGAVKDAEALSVWVNDAMCSTTRRPRRAHMLTFITHRRLVAAVAAAAGLARSRR
ncbi:hypothetical protein BH24ACT1_BH24ACT1_00290 [soil metagenome]